jgi:hypothetical protein
MGLGQEVPLVEVDPGVIPDSGAAASADSGYFDKAASWLKKQVADAALGKLKEYACRADFTNKRPLCTEADMKNYAIAAYNEKYGILPPEGAVAALFAPAGGNPRPFSKNTVDARIDANPPEKYGFTRRKVQAQPAAAAKPVVGRPGLRVPGVSVSRASVIRPLNLPAPAPAAGGSMAPAIVGVAAVAAAIAYFGFIKK